MQLRRLVLFQNINGVKTDESSNVVSGLRPQDDELYLVRLLDPGVYALHELDINSSSSGCGSRTLTAKRVAIRTTGSSGTVGYRSERHES